MTWAKKESKKMNIRRPDIKNVCFEKAELKWTAAATHYSKSQIFVQKFNFDKTLTFSRVFHPIFLTIFLVKSKLSTAKMSKNTTFSRVFHPKKSRQFPREIKVEFLDKKWRFRTVCYLQAKCNNSCKARCENWANLLRSKSWKWELLRHF